MNQKLFILLFVFIGFITSCSDENELGIQVPKEKSVEVVYINDIDFTVVDGVLSFKTGKDFFALGEKISNMSTVQVANWEKENGFVSLRSEIEYVFDKLETCEIIDEYKSILKQNADIIKIENELESPVIRSPFYQSVTNRKGYYIVEGLLHKITSEGLYTSDNRSFEAIENAVLNGIDKADIDVQFLSLSSSSSTKSTNSIHQVYDETNWYGRRKCFAEFYIDQVWYNDDPRTFKYYKKCQSKSIGRTLIGTRKLYKTSHYCDAFDYELRVPMSLIQGSGLPRYHYADSTKTCDGGVISNVKTGIWVAYTPVGVPITVSQAIIDQIGIPDATIQSIYAGFWTPGTTTDHKATLNYN